MFWPDTGTGVDVEPARKPVQSAIRKYFSEGGIGQPPTVPGGDWFNQMTNEVLNVLAAAGIEPDKMDDGQLAQAIAILIDGIRAELTTGSGSLACPYKVINIDIPPYNGDLDSAYDAAPSGSVLLLGVRTYNIVGKFTPAAPATKAVTLFGSGTPQLSADGSRWVDGTGTIIQGSYINRANGHKAYNLGIDVGQHVVDDLNSGVYLEGYVPGQVLPTDTAANLSTYITGVDFSHIKVLLKAPTADPATHKHGCLVEHTLGCSHGYVECIGGFHGYVNKAADTSTYGDVVAYGQAGDSAILKADSFSRCYGLTATLRLGKYGYTTKGLLFQADSYFGKHDLTVIGHSIDGRLLNQITGTFPMEDVSFQRIQCDVATDVAVVVPSDADRWNIADHSLINVQSTMYVSPGADVTLGNGFTTNVVGNGYVFDEEVRYDNLELGVVGGADFVVSKPLDRSGIKTVGRKPTITDTYDAKANLAMNGSWSDTNLTVYVWGDSFTLGGYVDGGSTDLIAVISNPLLRPTSVVTRPISVLTSTGYQVSTVIFSPNGEISVSQAAPIGSAGGKIYFDSLPIQHF